MSRTQKDSRKHQSTVIEVIKAGSDAFDLLLNHEVIRRNAPQAVLSEWLCVRYGFCGEEYEAMLREIEQEGRKVIVL